jgi:methylated-DNA-protein-cysteine methyltransferase-like protein
MSTLSRFRSVIRKVPRGKVITYGQVAFYAGFPGAARVTVWALHGERGLPWHRVVAAGGRIALPGDGGAEQRLRLKSEGVVFRGGRVRMDLHNWTPRKAARLAPPEDSIAIRGLGRATRPPWRRESAERDGWGRVLDG